VRAKLPENSGNTVFLNISYDARFRLLYLAYLTGLIHLGLDPRATIEIPGGRNRLDKGGNKLSDNHFSQLISI
jgi:hypothetical protein